MATDTSNVPIQTETILRQVQERTRPDYQFRRAFRDYDASNNDAETLQFPVRTMTLRSRCGTRRG